MKPVKQNTSAEILRLAASLFAAHGYDGVSMRDIADRAQLTPAALYYHFRDKGSLYQEVLDACFKEKVGALLAAVPAESDPWVRLEIFVERYTEMLARDVEFHRLIQWVYLDSNIERQAEIGKRLLNDFYSSVRPIIAAVAPNLDEYQTVLSLVALVSFPYQTMFLRQTVTGYDAEKEKPKNLTKHIVALFRHGVEGGGRRSV